MSEFVIIDELSSDDEQESAHKKRKITYFQTCRFCVQKYSTIEELDHHVHTAHHINCNFCTKILETRDKYFQHFRDRHRDQETRCLPCRKRFNRAKTFLEHLESEGHIWAATDRDISCASCEEGGLKSIEEYYLHFRGSHEDVELTCPQCLRNMVSLGEYVKHLVLAKHETDVRVPLQNSSKRKKIVVCNSKSDRCRKPSSDVGASGSSSSSAQSIKCEFCSKNLASQDAYQEHFDSRHVDKIRDCKPCGKYFGKHRSSRTSEFLEHIQSEAHAWAANTRQIRCFVCKEDRLKSIEKFHLHMRNSHPDVKQKCGRCGDVIKSLCEFVTHLVLDQNCDRTQ